MVIAMVCLGNICRSPMAEAVARAMLDEAGLGAEISVESFGTAGYHRGEGAHPQADSALRRHGWPAGGHRARQITEQDVARADLVLCADHSTLREVQRIAGGTGQVQRTAGAHQAVGAQEKICLLRSFVPPDLSDSSSPGARGRSFSGRADRDVPDPWGGDVPDPWGGDDAAFDEALDLIEEACRGLVGELAKTRR